MIFDNSNWKELLTEMPMIGQYLPQSDINRIGKELNSDLTKNDLVFSLENSIELGHGFFFMDSTTGKSHYDRTIILTQKSDAGKHELRFASKLEQMNFEIEGKRPYKVSFSAGYGYFPKRSASIAYIKFVNKTGELLCSDSKMSGQGVGIWMELLTRPELAEEVFVWNLVTKRRDPALDFKDIFGESDKYKNYIVVLSPKK